MARHASAASHTNCSLLFARTANLGGPNPRRPRHPRHTGFAQAGHGEKGGGFHAILPRLRVFSKYHHQCAISLNIIIIWQHNRQGPTVDPLGGLQGQVDAPVAHRVAKIIVPVSAMQRHTRPRDVTHPGDSRQVKAVALTGCHVA